MTKIFSRAAARVLLVTLVGAPAGCASGGGNVVLTPPPSPSPRPAAIAYTAIGASDAVGYGASKPCTKANPPIGPADPTCFGITGTGYVPVLARRLATGGASVTLDDLGYSGAVLGPDILATVNAYGLPDSATPCAPTQNYSTDFLTYELPRLPASATLVTIFAGGNDTIGLINAVACGAGGTTTPQQLAFLETQIAAFGTDLGTLVAGVKSAAPHAKIAIANLPNFALIPVGLAQSAATQQGLAFLSTQLDTQVIDPLALRGIAVVDLLCNAASYTSSNFYSDGFHPDDAGYALIAQHFYAQTTAATPALPNATCSYATEQATLRAPVSEGVRRI